ncbi:hypothetical protein DERF_005156 [Dermatophagoides farinae]|uniref:Uncharacterized protein n=1 Tax=Dermatophagoides farinae TaxID=6954 RepID=A0A922I5A7_DERFA|nr:hypothetical protein DERF_005156 [Dermatophagoides farinae]
MVAKLGETAKVFEIVAKFEFKIEIPLLFELFRRFIFVDVAVVVERSDFFRFLIRKSSSSSLSVLIFPSSSLSPVSLIAVVDNDVAITPPVEDVDGIAADVDCDVAAVVATEDLFIDWLVDEIIVDVFVVSLLLLLIELAEFLRCCDRLLLAISFKIFAEFFVSDEPDDEFRLVRCCDVIGDIGDGRFNVGRFDEIKPSSLSSLSNRKQLDCLRFGSSGRYAEQFHLIIKIIPDS